MEYDDHKPAEDESRRQITRRECMTEIGAAALGLPLLNEISIAAYAARSVSALDIPDYRLDSVGARGVGEIGITGTGAAVANAIFHATAKCVHDLPITPDKLI